MASTDLHAGGVLFSLVYRECLQFEVDGRVRWWREVLDTSRPYWDDVEEFRKLTFIGTYERNDRGYLVCKFPAMELTGTQCEDATNLIAFHVWYPLSNRSEGRVYHSPVNSGGHDEQRHHASEQLSEVCFEKEIAATAELLRICDEDERDDSYVRSIRSCLKCLRAGNVHDAVKHFRCVPLGGMMRFDDWYPADASNAALFDVAVQRWVQVMSPYVPIPRCACCGKAKHDGPCFEYLGG